MSLVQLAHSAYQKLCDVEERLIEIRESLTEDADYPVQRRRIPFTFNTDSSGDGQTTLQVPPGWTWNCLRFAGQTSAAVGGYIAIYRGAENGQLLLTVTEAGLIFSDSFTPEGDMIGGGEALLIVARGLGAVSSVNGNVAVRATQDTVPADV